jgi:hypothetical protein
MLFGGDETPGWRTRSAIDQREMQEKKFPAYLQLIGVASHRRDENRYCDCSYRDEVKNRRNARFLHSFDRYQCATNHHYKKERNKSKNL